jgi:hypothetical protein
MPPTKACNKPTTFEIALTILIGVYLRKRIIPATKSNIPIKKNVSISRDMWVSYPRMDISTRLNEINSVTPVKIVPIIMRKPPIATHTLSRFRICSLNPTFIETNTK